MKNCANCKFCQKDEDFPEDNVCDNEKSENYADWVDDNHVCEEWVKSENKD